MNGGKVKAGTPEPSDRPVPRLPSRCRMNRPVIFRGVGTRSPLTALDDRNEPRGEAVATPDEVADVRRQFRRDGWVAVGFWVVVGCGVEVLVRWWFSDVIPFP